MSTETESKRGRPRTGDAKDKRIYIRVNENDEKVLEYFSQRLGISKSDVVRKALTEYYQNVRRSN